MHEWLIWITQLLHWPAWTAIGTFLAALATSFVAYLALKPILAQKRRQESQARNLRIRLATALTELLPTLRDLTRIPRVVPSTLTIPADAFEMLVLRIDAVSEQSYILEADEQIDEFLESDQKLIVFCQHRKMVDALKRQIEVKSVIVDGRVTGRNRHATVQQFQNDGNTRLFIGNTKAAGVGITLTAASNVAFAELGWTPGEHLQAENRPHRIGQTDTVWVMLGITRIRGWLGPSDSPSGLWLKKNPFDSSSQMVIVCALNSSNATPKTHSTAMAILDRQ